MDLLMVTDRWNAAGGGRERYLAELQASLTRRGRSVALMVKEGIGERRLQRDIDVFRCSQPTSPVVAARPVNGATHYQLHSGVYANAFAAERDAYDSMLRRLCFWPALRLNTRRRRLLRVEEHLLGTDAGPQLMVFSTRTRDEIQRAFGTPAERIALARPGIDLRVFRPSRGSSLKAVHRRPEHPQAGCVQLLFAGHNFALKGLRWAFEAVAQARRSGINAHLTVAGSGPIRTFSAVARRLGIARHVHFTGAVARDVLAQTYRDSDLLIHPTFYDPFPRVIVEALASGSPVVTTRACGAAEIISPGRTGFIVDHPRDIEAFTEAIAAVADPDRREQMGTEAADTGRRFDFEAHVDAVSAWLGRR